MENVGFPGHANHPARQNIRPVDIDLYGGKWALQYSPYGYYNEHCIVLNQVHCPMKIDAAVFEKLFDFVEQFPHYFLGSNADLPIVGGSILSHEHFQGGHYTFAMETAPIENTFKLSAYPSVNAGTVKWPMSVIRLNSSDRKELAAACTMILEKWRAYSDPDADIYAFTDDTPHNTITPIARIKDGKYECDLVLRNNRTTEERPLGLFHPRAEYHHIKKENIGLIEVMGLAVLPARLAVELKELEKAMLEGKDIASIDSLASHAEWAKQVLDAHPEFNADNAEDIIRNEVGAVFAHVLEDAGIYKRDENGQAAFMRFIDSVR
jgi:UDPglucose--hexose-1-phosphate uridylyltransferase